METESAALDSMAIAIDGPAASGKSSVARRLAKRLGFLFVNSGAVYRGVTWHCLEKGVDVEDSAAVIDCLEAAKIECAAAGGVSTLLIDGVDPEPFLSSEAVNRSVSKVAAIPEVRRAIVDRLVAYRELGDLVMEGRDIGSVVFPDSPFKFYIDASEDVRNERRRKQGLTDEISERDRRDSSRSASPLVIPRDARVIDSSDLSIEGVIDEIVAVLRDRGMRKGVEGDS